MSENTQVLQAYTRARGPTPTIHNKSPPVVTCTNRSSLTGTVGHRDTGSSCWRRWVGVAPSWHCGPHSSPARAPTYRNSSQPPPPHYWSPYFRTCFGGRTWEAGESRRKQVLHASQGMRRMRRELRGKISTEEDHPPSGVIGHAGFMK